MKDDTLMDSIYSLIDEIKKSVEYQELKESWDKLKDNKECLALIDRLDKAKTAYSINPNDKECIKELSTSNSLLAKNELVSNYNSNLKRYNKMVEEIEKEINSAFYGENFKKLMKAECKHDKKS